MYPFFVSGASYGSKRLQYVTLILSSLLSISLAQDAQGLVCQFTEPFYTVRYRYESKILTLESFDFVNLTLEHATANLKKENREFLQYVISIPGAKINVLTATRNNRGSDGMSSELYPFSAVYGEQIGGCTELSEVGTHEVFGTSSQKDPWLNLRDSPGTTGKVVGKLGDGSELRIVAKDGVWRNVRVLTGFEGGRTGWVHSKWMRKLEVGKKIGGETQ